MSPPGRHRSRQGETGVARGEWAGRIAGAVRERGRLLSTPRCIYPWFQDRRDLRLRHRRSHGERDSGGDSEHPAPEEGQCAGGAGGAQRDRLRLPLAMAICGRRHRTITERGIAGPIRPAEL